MSCPECGKNHRKGKLLDACLSKASLSWNYYILRIHGKEEINSEAELRYKIMKEYYDKIHGGVC